LQRQEAIGATTFCLVGMHPLGRDRASGSILQRGGWWDSTPRLSAWESGRHVFSHPPQGITAPRQSSSTRGNPPATHL